MSLLSYNIFQAFFQLNLKDEFQRGKTMLHCANMIKSQLYAIFQFLVGSPRSFLAYSDLLLAYYRPTVQTDKLAFQLPPCASK